MVADLKEKTGVNNKNVRSVSDFVRSAIPSLQHRVIALEKESEQTLNASGRHSNQDLRQSIRDIYAQIRLIQSERISERNVPDPSMNLIPSRMSELEVKIQSLIAASDGGGSFAFGGHRFQSPSDVERILEEELPDASIADFPELFGILCQVSDKFTDGKAYADKSRSSLSIDSTNAEVDVMATMTHPVPLVLFSKAEGKSTLMDPEKGFGHQLDTYSKFSGKQAAFRQVITRRTNDLLLSIRGNLRSTGVCADLSRHLCAETKNQLAEILTLLADWHDELTNQCDYPSKVAWEFEGFMIRAIMEHLAPPRVEVASVSGLSSSRSKSLIIWAIMQVHVRLNEVIEAKFKSHPVVTTAIANFTMKTRVDRSHIMDVTEKMKDATKSSVNTEKRIASLEAELKTLKQSLGNKIASLEKKK